MFQIYEIWHLVWFFNLLYASWIFCFFYLRQAEMKYVWSNVPGKIRHMFLNAQFVPCCSFHTLCFTHWTKSIMQEHDLLIVKSILYLILSTPRNNLRSLFWKSSTILKLNQNLKLCSGKFCNHNPPGLFNPRTHIVCRKCEHTDRK